MRKFEIRHEGIGFRVFVSIAWGKGKTGRNIRGPVHADTFSTARAAIGWAKEQFSVPETAWVEDESGILRASLTDEEG